MPVTISGSGITGIPPGGYPDQSVTADDLATAIKLGETLQTKYATKTDTATFYSINTFTDIADLSVDITPSSTDSKILILSTLCINSHENYSWARIAKEIGGTTSALTDLTSTALQTSNSETQFGNLYGVSHQSDNWCFQPTTFIGVHSPATTSTITFKAQFKIEGAYTAYLNRPHTGNDSSSGGRNVSTLIVSEIK